MKHILNNLTEEEKNAIREQHTGGMKVMNENFSKLVNTKLGDVKPLVNEQSHSGNVTLSYDELGQKVAIVGKMDTQPKKDSNGVSFVISFDPTKNNLFNKPGVNGTTIVYNCEKGNFYSEDKPKVALYSGALSKLIKSNKLC